MLGMVAEISIYLQCRRPCNVKIISGILYLYSVILMSDISKVIIRHCNELETLIFTPEPDRLMRDRGRNRPTSLFQFEGRRVRKTNGTK